MQEGQYDSKKHEFDEGDKRANPSKELIAQVNVSDSRNHQKGQPDSDDREGFQNVF